MIFSCGHEFFDDDLQACPICKPVGGKNKYGAKPVKDEIDGYFHSSGEYKRWCQLKILQAAGEISDLERQVRFRLLASVRRTYVVDFTYKEVVHGRQQKIAEDFKGAITPEYRAKKAAFQAEYPEYIFRETTSRQATKRRGHGFKAAKRKNATYGGADAGRAHRAG